MWQQRKRDIFSASESSKSCEKSYHAAWELEHSCIGTWWTSRGFYISSLLHWPQPLPSPMLWTFHRVWEIKIMNWRDPREIPGSIDILWKSKSIFYEKMSSSLIIPNVLNGFKWTFRIVNLNRFAWFLQHSNRLVNTNTMRLKTF